MATAVVNPTNAKPFANMALPFIRSGKEPAKAIPIKDAFNSGKEYKDEGAPLLTSDFLVASSGKYIKPHAAVLNNYIQAPTPEEMDMLAHMDEKSQTQIKYLKEAVVMDVDAKLIVSTMSEMKNGRFKEAHYSTMSEYIKSDHYKKLRESTILAQGLSGVAKKTRLRESSTVAGIRLNPRLVVAMRAADRNILSGMSKAMREMKRLQESFTGRKLREDSFSLDTQSAAARPTFDDGSRGDPDFVPLMGGPWSKQLYWFDYLDMHSKAFEAATHNPVAKRILKVISQFVLGKGVKLTVTRAVSRAEQQKADSQPAAASQPVQTKLGPQATVRDYRKQCQSALDRHWMKNSMHTRSKQILHDLLCFGEQFVRYFDAPWGLKIRQMDPSTIQEVVTDADDCENEFYVHQQYPTRYQNTFASMGPMQVPMIKFIIRQVPASHYYHMKINSTAGEVRGRSELFAILGWLKRLKEFASDRVIRNKMSNLFVLDVSVDGTADDVAQVQQQLSTPPTPGSFFFHNKAAELKGISAEVGAGEIQGDWEMLLTIIAMGAGISQQYLGMGTGQGGKAAALVGTEPDVKTFEDHQEMMEQFFEQDAERVFNRAKERHEIPLDLIVTVETTYPSLAEENRSEKLKDLAFGESMSWWSHRRIAAAASKEMQFTSYEYDEEQKQIAQEDALKEFLINAAYAQVNKGADKAAGAAAPGGDAGGSGGDSGMGMGAPGSGKSADSAGGATGESEQPSMESLEETGPSEPLGAGIYPSNARRTKRIFTTEAIPDKRLRWEGSDVDESGNKDPYRGADPRDIGRRIQREATNLRYTRHDIGRRQDRVQSPHKVRDQNSLDRGALVTNARKALKRGNLNKE